MQDNARVRIAANVRAELGRRGLSQRDAAAILSLPQNSVNLRVRGLRSFKAEEIAALAAALEVTPSDLMAGAIDRESVAA